jgi:hypothetical protein
MPKREWTEAERKAFGEKMKQKRLERQQAQEQLANAPAPSTDPDLTALTKQVQEALAEIQRLKASQTPVQAPQQASANGGVLTGTYERYTMNPAHYPNPCARLAKEPRLARFAFDENYELSWEVQVSQYETVDKIRTKEPRFVIKLIVKVYDEETGELTDRRFVILTGIFHEDPDAALSIARENGIEVDATDEKTFLDEMRYLRFRDWLLEAFYPTPPPASKAKKEVVIGNKLVEVYEVSSTKTENMAAGFASMTKKL